MTPHDERITFTERVDALTRRLLVLEQLFMAASHDPDGRPFSTTDGSAMYYGLVEIVQEVREELRNLAR